MVKYLQVDHAGLQFIRGSNFQMNFHEHDPDAQRGVSAEAEETESLCPNRAGTANRNNCFCPAKVFGTIALLPRARKPPIPLVEAKETVS